VTISRKIMRKNEKIFEDETKCATTPGKYDALKRS
jgi:hypothetical protein